MNRILSSAVVVAGLVLTLGSTVSWGQVPDTNDTSDISGNTGGGTEALEKVTPGVPTAANGIHNTAYGYRALFSNTTGDSNTAVGRAALLNNNGSDNTAVGRDALISNTTGNYNTASGAFALLSNTTGSANTASGLAALEFNTTGSNNTATGAGALESNLSGINNTAVGIDALLSNTTGHANTASGAFALESNLSGINNTATGIEALNANNTGSYNTALGYRALSSSTGSRNTAIGYNAGTHLQSGNNNIYLGHTGPSTESTTMRLGSVQTRTFITGIRGVSVGSTGAQVFINGSGQLGTLVSSARYKRDIQPMGERSQAVHHLRPVTFRYKHDPHGQEQYGLIAEEVAKVYPELVIKGADGKVESVQYHELIPMLLNEVQHQQQEIVELQAQAQQVAELKAQNEEQRAQNAALAARLERLEQGATRTAAAALR